jgi:hypothetical protein
MAPVVGLYFVSGHKFNYNIAKTLSLAGCRVLVRSELSETELADTKHPLFVERQYSAPLFSDQGIEIVSNTSKAPTIDALLFEICTTEPRYPDELKDWIDTARHVTAWNTGFHEYRFTTNLRSELNILSIYWRYLIHAHTVVVWEGRSYLRPTGLFGKVRPQGFFPHNNFLSDPTLQREMYKSSWRPDAVRRISMIFFWSSGQFAETAKPIKTDF